MNVNISTLVIITICEVLSTININKKILQFCPVWVAPNLLTFSGFLLTVLNFLLFSYYDYGFNALAKDNINNDYIPSWVWALSAINLFVAYTLGEHEYLLHLYNRF